MSKSTAKEKISLAQILGRLEIYSLIEFSESYHAHFHFLALLSLLLYVIKPNILMIRMIGFMEVHPRSKIPNLDKLAKDYAMDAFGYGSSYDFVRLLCLKVKQSLLGKDFG